MALDKNKQSALRAADYQQSTNDPNKWINKSNNHWVKSVGDSTIISTDRHNRYGNGQSNSDFKGRL